MPLIPWQYKTIYQPQLPTPATFRLHISNTVGKTPEVSREHKMCFERITRVHSDTQTLRTLSNAGDRGKRRQPKHS